MSKATMLHYLLQNGWRMISFNYVVWGEDTKRPMDIVQAYVTQRHRERLAAHAAAHETYLSQMEMQS